METKYAAMFAVVGTGQESVTQVCDRLGISRKSYYKYRARFAAEGTAGLTPRSRRPRSSPVKTPPEMVQLIVAARARLLKEGWDNGALSIRNRLLRDGHLPPAWRTIHRVLVREGLVEPEPKKRPRSSWRRFEFPAPDDCWQIDAFDYRLADGRAVVVFEIKDDCSRAQVASLAWPAEDTQGAWECVVRGIDAFGLPKLMLSDNGLAFSGKLHHTMVVMEKNLIALKIKPITSRPWHPQTCGKNERGHSTLRRWLAARPTSSTLVGLQALLDEYQTAYNTRPHQGLDVNQTPLERRIAARRHPAADTDVFEQPTLVRHCQVKPRGYLSWDGYHIAVGRELAGKTLLVFATGEDLVIFYKHHVVRTLTLDRSRRHQPLTEPRRRDANRDRLIADLDADALHRAGPRPAPVSPAASAVAAPGQGRPKAVAQRSRQRPLKRRNGADTVSAAASATTHHVSPMS
jgi:transposase